MRRRTKSISLLPQAWQIAPEVRPGGLSDQDPIVQEGHRLSPALEALAWPQRPMIWPDLLLFEARYGRTPQDMSHDLGIQMKSSYHRSVQAPLVVPYDVEFLVALYERFPSPCPWQRASVREVFDMLYGPLIAQFDEDLRVAAVRAYGKRFGCLMGRARTVQYRWLSDRAAMGAGTTRRVEYIVTKIREAAERGLDARLFAEEIAADIWRRRGFDFDRAVPAYTPQTLREAMQILKKSTPKRTRRDKTPRAALSCLVPGTYAGGAFSTPSV